METQWRDEADVRIVRVTERALGSDFLDEIVEKITFDIGIGSEWMPDR